jgi:hypothetical protein
MLTLEGKVKTYSFYAGKSNGWREKGERYHLREHVPGWRELRWREPRMAARAPYPGYPSRSPGKRSATGVFSGTVGPPVVGTPDSGASALSGLPVSRSPGKRSATGGISGCGGPPVVGARMAARAPYPGYPSHVAPVSAARPGIFSGAVGIPRWREPPDSGASALSGLPVSCRTGKRSATGDIFGCGGPPGGGNSGWWAPGWRRERLIRATRLMSPR